MDYRIARLALLLVAAAACGAGGGDSTELATADGLARSAEATPVADTAGREEVCRNTGALQPLPSAIREASGAAASRRQPGVFWTHNDSGKPEIFGIDATGKQVARVRVRGAELEDWEDIALGPCPSGDCLYIGDNAAKRPSVTIYRVPEPSPGDTETRPAQAIRARYPDGPHDAEALFVLPNGRIHVVTKGESGPVALYRLPSDPQAGQVVDMERLRELTTGEANRKDRITGGDVSPNGKWIVLRTLDELSIYPAEDFLRDGSVQARKAPLRALKEPQGEGVAFASEGRLILTSEAGKKGNPATFTRMECDLE